MLTTGLVCAGTSAKSEDQQLRLDTDFDCMEQQLMEIRVNVSKVRSVVWQEVQADTGLTVSP